MSENDSNSNDNSQEYTRAGGVIGLQLGGQVDLAAPEQAPREQTRVVGGADHASRVDSEGRITEIGGITRAPNAGMADVNSLDILATARNPQTQTPARSYTPKTIVDIQTAEGRMPGVSIELACSMGYLRKTGEGVYEETGKAAAERGAQDAGKV